MNTSQTASTVMAYETKDKTAECDWSHWPLTMDSARGVQRETPSEGKNELIAKHYKHVGLAEHASVASFSRAVLGLMELGAPAWLLDRTMVAAREEIHHAQMAFAIARSWSHEPFYISGMEDLLKRQENTGLDEFVVRTVREACAGETPAVLRVAVALRFVQDAQIREYLNTVLVEERRHAELAWSTVAWALLTEVKDGATAGSLRPAHLAAKVALASAVTSLWGQANTSVIERQKQELDGLLKVGILSSEMEKVVARVAAPLVEGLGAELLSGHVLANGIGRFEAVVHQNFEDALDEAKGFVAQDSELV